MDKDFLQSDEWRKFQGAVGRPTFLVGQTSIIEHELPVVGKYFYVPRGDITQDAEEIIKLARKENAGWIRIDTDYKNDKYKIIKAPHDVQPKEVFIVDISKAEEQLLAEMKSKTRYNIRLAEKKGVNVFATREDKYFEDFLRLTKITAKRDGIAPHPDDYYRKMFETIPPEIMKLYVAEYEGRIIAANLVVFYKNTATYLHGASDNEYRNVMAPYLLQWTQIQDAKKAGCAKYDFGGVSIQRKNEWAGITRFKTGFSGNTQPVEFAGSYDIVINPLGYWAYRIIQRAKSIL